MAKVNRIAAANAKKAAAQQRSAKKANAKIKVTTKKLNAAQQRAAKTAQARSAAQRSRTAAIKKNQDRGGGPWGHLAE